MIIISATVDKNPLEEVEKPSFNLDTGIFRTKMDWNG